MLHKGHRVSGLKRRMMRSHQRRGARSLIRVNCKTRRSGLIASSLINVLLRVRHLYIGHCPEPMARASDSWKIRFSSWEATLLLLRRLSQSRSSESLPTGNNYFECLLITYIFFFFSGIPTSGMFTRYMRTNYAYM